MKGQLAEQVESWKEEAISSQLYKIFAVLSGKIDKHVCQGWSLSLYLEKCFFLTYFSV